MEGLINNPSRADGVGSSTSSSGSQVFQTESELCAPALLAQFQLLTAAEWLKMSCINSQLRAWFERSDVWQAAFYLSAWRSEDEQDENDLAQMSMPVLRSIATKMMRVANRRPIQEKLLFPTFPASSPLRLQKHGSFHVLQQGTADKDHLGMATGKARVRSHLGCKLWGACELFCSHLERGRENWAAGLSDWLCLGSDVIELGCGMGLLGVAISRLCSPKSVLLTDNMQSCISLSRATAALNLPGSDCKVSPVNAELLNWSEKVKPHARAAFDVVVASDVSYQLDLVDDLWKTIAAVLRPRGAVIIGHIDRTPSSTERLFSRATKCGFWLAHNHDLHAVQDPPQTQARLCPGMLLVFTRLPRVKPVKVRSQTASGLDVMD